jgi:hypothetical protein
LGNWTLGPSTAGFSSHNGIAGVPEHLYTTTRVFGVTTRQVEMAPIVADGSFGTWSLVDPLMVGRVFGIMLASGESSVPRRWLDR